jgi:hypothetical protein
MTFPYLRLSFKIFAAMLVAASATACEMALEAATATNPVTKSCALPLAPSVTLRNKQGAITDVLEPQTIDVFEESIDSPEGKLRKIRLNGYILEDAYKALCSP